MAKWSPEHEAACFTAPPRGALPAVLLRTPCCDRAVKPCAMVRKVIGRERTCPKCGVVWGLVLRPIGPTRVDNEVAGWIHRVEWKRNIAS